MFQIIAVIDIVYFFNSVSEQNAKHLFFSKTKNQDLLLIEFEGRTGSYGPSFFSRWTASIFWSTSKAKRVQYKAKRVQYRI